MIMHLAQTISDECYNPNSLFFNSGNMFVNRHPKDFHALAEIFNIPNIPIYNTTCSKSFTQINRHWYKNKKYTKNLQLIYENIELSPRLQAFVRNYKTVVHIRAENDWVHVAKMCARKHHCYSIEDIFSKIGDSRVAVAISSKNARNNIVRTINHYFDMIMPSIDNFSYTENAAIHMLSAVNSIYFWGNWFSTFSKGVANMRRARGLNSFFYNCIQKKPFYDNFKFVCDKASVECPQTVNFGWLEDIWKREHFRGPLQGPMSYFKRVPPHYLGNRVSLTNCKRRIYIDIGSRDFDEGMLQMFKIYPALLDFDEFYAFEAAHGLYKIPIESVLVQRLRDVGMSHSRANTFLKRHFFQRAFISAVTNKSADTIGLLDLIVHQMKVHERDVLIIKMDIEGHEYETLSYLIENGGHKLIDELLVELHYDHPRMRKLFNWCASKKDDYIRHHLWCSHTLDDATILMKTLRKNKIYAHSWP